MTLSIPRLFAIVPIFYNDRILLMNLQLYFKDKTIVATVSVGSSIGEPTPKKVKSMKSRAKRFPRFFWNSRGIALNDWINDER